MARTKMRPSAVALALSALAALAEGQTIPTGKSIQQFSYGGINRQFIVYKPNRQSFTGMMILLHGYTEDANRMYSVGEVEHFADQHGFVGVVPTGRDENGANVRRRLDRGWNVDTCCGYPHNNRLDSVGFIRELVSWMKDRVTVPSNKVFAGGFSNGCALTYHLLCEASDVITGGGCHGSAYDHQYTGAPYTCNPQVKRPMYTSVGQYDNFYPLPATRDGWIRYSENVLGCSGTQQVSNENWVTCEDFVTCPNNNRAAKYCIYWGLGHEYPERSRSPWMLSPTGAAWEWLNAQNTTGPLAETQMPTPSPTPPPTPPATNVNGAGTTSVSGAQPAETQCSWVPLLVLLAAADRGGQQA